MFAVAKLASHLRVRRRPRAVRAGEPTRARRQRLAPDESRRLGDEPFTTREPSGTVNPPRVWSPTRDIAVAVPRRTRRLRRSNRSNRAFKMDPIARQRESLLGGGSRARRVLRPVGTERREPRRERRGERGARAARVHRGVRRIRVRAVVVVVVVAASAPRDAETSRSLVAHLSVASWSLASLLSASATPSHASDAASSAASSSARAQRSAAVATRRSASDDAGSSDASTSRFPGRSGLRVLGAGASPSPAPVAARAASWWR